ncbi:MAG: ABC transporter ATP-binding protein [Wenzhouxiangella sp.]
MPHNLTASDNTVFRAVGLTRTYRMGEVTIHALRGVDLTLSVGEMLVMLGASGSGKSTLLNILGGLDRPSSGHLYYHQQDLAAASDRELTAFRRDHVGFVFQFYNMIPSLTALENVAIVTDIARNPMPPEEALALVGLADRRDHFPSQLSGGEQQRVAIARAIAKQPAVLMCDEPTGALDSATGVRVLEVIDRINRELKTTTLIITHNQALGQMADRLIRLKDGQIDEDHANPDRRAPAEIEW